MVKEKESYKSNDVTFVNSKNVFVNATLQNIEEVKKCKNELLINKKIMYEMIDM